MTFRNKSIDVGDLVESVFIDSSQRPVLMGVVIDFPEAWKDRKVNVLWNEIGVRLEWLNDIRRVNTE
jgi:hypothetical protein